MVEYHTITDDSVIEPLTSSRSIYNDMFDDLIKGKTIYIYGPVEELRLKRKRVLSAYHFRINSDNYPDFNINISTQLSSVKGKPALVIKPVNNGG